MCSLTLLAPATQNRKYRLPAINVDEKEEQQERVPRKPVKGQDPSM